MGIFLKQSYFLSSRWVFTALCWLPAVVGEWGYSRARAGFPLWRLLLFEADSGMCASAAAARTPGYRLSSCDSWASLLPGHVRSSQTGWNLCPPHCDGH